ncbi:Ig-like domain-containing protein [Pseudoalteromonas sp. T1lg24]|uniref:Ig-like domain-containing protein n=1 Tax=Pseudoalteromonas sp. T1lg24 TaxID=2077099 RepID=UPI000CF627E8|nr:Ig-like domain-containing protein [Pseudoalteromonas sp. T1lg24]
MKKFKLLPLALATAVVLSGCSESDDPAALIKAVELESQRANGTLVEKIEFNGSGVRLRAGQTHQLVAMGTDSKGEVRDISKEVTWTSSNTDVATIDSSGLVTAVKALADNQGLVTFTATTINDIEATTELSISDSKATALDVVLKNSDSNQVTTCVDAQLAATITYQDGYVSAPDTNLLTWQLAGSATASVDAKGLLSTSAEDSEELTITAKHTDGVTGSDTFSTSIAQLSALTIQHSDKNIESLAMELAQRESLKPQLTLLNGDTHIISNSAIWAASDSAVAAVSNESEVQGNIVALTSGTTNVFATCGGQQAQVSVEVTGDSTLNGLKINTGAESMSIKQGAKVSLQAFADLAGVSDDFNVSEFAGWSFSGTDLVTSQFKKLGTNEAYLEVSASSSKTGSFTLISSYRGKSETIDITVVK